LTKSISENKGVLLPEERMSFEASAPGAFVETQEDEIGILSPMGRTTSPGLISPLKQSTLLDNISTPRNNSMDLPSVGSTESEDSGELGPLSPLKLSSRLQPLSPVKQNLMNSNSVDSTESEDSEELGPLSPLRLSSRLTPLSPIKQNLIEVRSPLKTNALPINNEQLAPLSPFNTSRFSPISPLNHTTSLNQSAQVRNVATVQPRDVAGILSPIRPMPIANAIPISPLRLTSPIYTIPSQGIANLPVASLESISHADKVIAARDARALNGFENTLVSDQSQYLPQVANVNANLDIEEIAEREAKNPGYFLPISLRKLIWWYDGALKTIDDKPIETIGANGEPTPEFKALNGVITDLQEKRTEHIQRILQDNGDGKGKHVAHQKQKNKVEVFAQATEMAINELSAELQYGIDAHSKGNKLITEHYGKSLEELSEEERARMMKGVTSIGAYTIAKEFTKDRINEPAASTQTDTSKLQKQLNEARIKAAIESKRDLILVTDFFKDVTLLPMGFVTGVFELLNEGNPNNGPNGPWLKNVLTVLKVFSDLLGMPFDMVQESLRKQIDTYIDAHVPEAQRAGVKRQIKDGLDKALKKTPGVRDYSEDIKNYRGVASKQQTLLHINYRNSLNIGPAYPG